VKALLKNKILPLGCVVATPSADDTLFSVEIEVVLRRHQNYDWGEVSEADWRSNNEAVLKGFRILSAYRSTTGEKFWIITEAGRSVTTILLPSDY